MDNKLQIRSRIRCPSCWAELNPADLLWVSAHPDLLGDPFLGQDAQKRFLPSRFDAEGFAIDAHGMRCHSLACPKCHLAVPRILLEFRPLFLSIIGAPSSGKSYFLASAIWETRQRLQQFNVSFTDADPVANQVIGDYEKKLFLNDEPDKIVAVKKTEPEGELYQSVDYGTRQELYSRPFVFSMQPKPQHPAITRRNGVSVRNVARALCLYDNAGEHFQPTLASEVSPATDHLALSQVLLYVFDPLQHPRFRQQCRGHSSDPQLSPDFRTYRQDEILLEATKRIRQKANLPQHEHLPQPLVVVVNKFDVWSRMIPALDLQQLNPYELTPQGMGVNRRLLNGVSDQLRGLLTAYAPEVVAACDSVSNDVTFVPVSPQGCSPEFGEGLLGIRPRNVRPVWAEVPLLYAISRAKCSLVPTAVQNGVPDHDESADPNYIWPPRVYKGAS
ncbi:MAG: hypothetical protein HYV60_21470 [Planctomycetia bacterium]|nr:hypothetical protein [Planctomycetia bacterium]